MIDERWKFEEELELLDDQSLEELLYAQYHGMMSQKLEKKRLSNEIDDGDYIGPTFTVRLNAERDSGFVLRVEDIAGSFESVADPTRFLASVPQDPYVLGYAVQRVTRAVITLAVYYGYDECPNGARDGKTTWWNRQLNAVNRAANSFSCPLCGALTPELFLSADHFGPCRHFGCVPCTATVDPTRKRGMRRPG
jgi:hypothetical protein